MPRKKIRTGDYINYSFWLDMKLRIELETLAEKEGLSLSQFIERTLKEKVESSKS